MYKKCFPGHFFINMTSLSPHQVHNGRLLKRKQKAIPAIPKCQLSGWWCRSSLPENNCFKENMVSTDGLFAFKVNKKECSFTIWHYFSHQYKIWCGDDGMCNQNNWRVRAEIKCCIQQASLQIGKHNAKCADAPFWVLTWVEGRYTFEPDNSTVTYLH